MTKTEQELIDALEGLQKQLHAHLRMDVKKHYSLMVADAHASKLIHNIRAEQEAKDAPASALWSFEDVKAALAGVATHDDLVALNEEVERRFSSDKQEVVMSDEDWSEWTALLSSKSEELNKG